MFDVIAVRMMQLMAINEPCPLTPGDGGEFFGFPTWYKYLAGEKGLSGRCMAVLNEPKDFALVGIAVLDMLVRIAGVLAMVYVIYGGTKMIMAQGDPEKIKVGRNTVINALIGVVIAIIATAVVTFIGSRF